MLTAVTGIKWGDEGNRSCKNIDLSLHALL